VWEANGRELFFRTRRGKLVAVTLAFSSGATAPSMEVVRRDSPFLMNSPSGSGEAIYAVEPDGRSFIFLRVSGVGTPPVVVLGWLDELRERMREAGRP